MEGKEQYGRLDCVSLQSRNPVPTANVARDDKPAGHLRHAEARPDGVIASSSPMIYLTRKCEFSASHYYHNPEFTPEENQRIFGKCANLNGHGHNYTLEVTVKGEVDRTTGFVVDLKQLKEILESRSGRSDGPSPPEQGSSEFADADSDHRRTSPLPSGTGWSAKLKLAKLHRVRVYEMPDLFVDYYGEA